MTKLFINLVNVFVQAAESVWPRYAEIVSSVKPEHRAECFLSPQSEQLSSQ